MADKRVLRGLGASARASDRAKAVRRGCSADGAFFKGGIDIRKPGQKINGDAKEVPVSDEKAAALVRA